MSMRLSLITALLLALQGCSSNGAVQPPVRVQPYGPGMWSVSYSSLRGPSAAKHACVRDANLFCR